MMNDWLQDRPETPCWSCLIFTVLDLRWAADNSTHLCHPDFHRQVIGARRFLGNGSELPALDHDPQFSVGLVDAHLHLTFSAHCVEGLDDTHGLSLYVCTARNLPYDKVRRSAEGTDWRVTPKSRRARESTNFQPGLRTDSSNMGDFHSMIRRTRPEELVAKISP